MSIVWENNLNESRRSRQHDFVDIKTVENKGRRRKL